MSRSKKRDLCQGPILSNMFMYALPVMATGILQVLYNAADTIVIGQFAGDQSLAAVSCTGALTNLIVNLFLGLSTGVLTVVARHIGAAHHKRVRQSVHTSILLALACGVFLMVLGVLISGPMLKLMGAGAEAGSTVLPKATLYMRIYFLGAPGFLVYNFGASILRAAGDTKRPLIYLTVSGFLNVALNLVFVIVFHMDVAGVAVATIASQYLSAVLVVVCLLRETGDIRLELKRLRIYPKRLTEILRMGIPSGIQSTLFSFSNVLIQSTVNSFGDLYVAGNGAASQIENVLYTTTNSFYTATMAFTSQNFGAHKKDRIKKTLLSGLFLNTVTILTLSSIVMLFADTLLSLFTTNPVALEAARHRMQLTTMFTFVGGIMDIFTGHLRGLGASLVPMLTTLAGVCGLRVVWIFTAFPLLGGTWDMLYLCYPITWAVTAFAHFLYSRYVKRTVLDRLSDRPAISTPSPTEEVSTEETSAVADFDDDSDEDELAPLAQP
ncbi:MAG: MATE family efflux transporter [Clostridia bacterium]|nr:MATE family efflux transporter [Clostridia bacterium]